MTIIFISISVGAVNPAGWLSFSSIVVLASFAACGFGTSEGSSGRPTVVASFYPLVFAAQEVGGPFVEVQNLTPSGVEPHDLELTADQIRDISDADLVVFLGKGFQPAVEDVVSGTDDARVLDPLAGRHLLQGSEEEGSAAADPHVWLDPTIMRSIVDEVTSHLSEIDPSHQTEYEDSAEALDLRLAQLDDEFKSGLENCKSRDIVTSHAAFGYLAHRYDLNQISISGIDPESEPSPGRLAEVARFVRDHDVGTICFEELVSPEIAETIAAETGAHTEVLSPLESQPESGDYVTSMETNLAALTKALDCD